IRDGVKFTDGSPLTAADVAASWQEIVSPPPGKTSARQAFYVMVDKVEAPDPGTVVFRLKRPSTAFLPALADPFAFIYKKAVLDKDPHWYEKNILGSGPFKLEAVETGQSIRGIRNPDYYHSGRPYLDGFIGIYADKQATSPINTTAAGWSTNGARSGSRSPRRSCRPAPGSRPCGPAISRSRSMAIARASSIR